jgi:YjbR
MARVERIEPDADVVARLGSIAWSLPEAHEEDAWTGVRWRVRARTFAHVMVAQPGYESSFRDLTGVEEPTTVLTFHATGHELLALVHVGLPFYKPPWSPTVVGMVIDDGTDWDEVEDLVVESYRCCAPQKLVRVLDDGRRQHPFSD